MKKNHLFLAVILILVTATSYFWISSQKSGSKTTDNNKHQNQPASAVKGQSAAEFTPLPSIHRKPAADARKPDLVLAPLDHSALIRKHTKEAKEGRHIFATQRIVSIAPHLAGDWRAVGDEARWDFAVESTGARSLNLAFSRFHLPPGAVLTISDPKGGSKPISFTSKDNDAHGQLWTPLFATDQLQLALRMPKALAPRLALHLAKVNHGFRSASRNLKVIGDASSGSCNIDVICSADDDPTFGPLIDQFRDQIRSVAAFTMNGIETCSGALINNTENDQRPLFLTAHHCGINTTNAASLVAYWNFENSFCRPPGSLASGSDGDGPVTEFNTGSIFRASRELSDFCLIEFDDPIDPDTNPFYAGWDRGGAIPAFTVGIHHPSVSEKRISFDLESPTITTYAGDAPNSAGTHFRIGSWNFGTTEGGSSGSPLFDGQGRIIGQLHGGSAACGNNFPDWYGRLFRSWSDGNAASSRLSDWLDPGNTGAVQIDGTNGLESLSLTGGSVFEGNTGITQFTTNVILSGPVDQTVTVRISTQDGTAVGGTDFNPLDNELITFNPGETSQQVVIEILTDLTPEEHESFTLVLTEAENAEVDTEPEPIIILNDDYITPDINSPLAADAAAGTLLQYQVTALNTPTSYAISNAPAGMTIDSITGIITWIPATEGTATVDLIATNPAGSDTETLVFTVAPNVLYDALEVSATLNLINFDPGWIRQTADSLDGEDAAQAIPINNNQTATFTLGVSGPDKLVFWAKVSSEEDFDFLTGQIDGKEVFSVSGEIDWHRRTLVIPEGDHVLTFSYSKDEVGTAGSDVAMLDNFAFATDTRLPGIISDNILYVDTGAPINYTVESVGPAPIYSVNNLPAGLTFDGTNQITGAINTPGVYYVYLRAESQPEDEEEPSQVDTEILTITVATPVGPSLEVPDLDWVYDGPAQWFGQTAVTYDGVDAAQAGEVINSQETSMSITVSGPDFITFWWKVSSEENFDMLEFLIDDESVASISGEKDWAHVFIEIPEGEHTLTWRYSKDRSLSAGRDTGWVDNIGFASTGQALVLVRDEHTAVSGEIIRIPIEFINETSHSFVSLPTWLSYDAERMELAGTPPNRGIYSFSATATNEMGSFTAPIRIIAGETNNSLRSGLDQLNLTTSNGRDINWFNSVAAGAEDGVAARSGIIDHGESSTMTLHVQGPGTLDFRWMVSSQFAADFLTYTHNNRDVVAISGEVGWTDVSIDLEPGINSITWKYSKDATIDNGEDLGRVDDVRLSGYAAFLTEGMVNHFSAIPTSDTDGDQLSLLHEYAFLGSATAIDSGDVLNMTPAATEGDFDLEFEGLNNPSNVEYVLQYSETMEEGTWINSSIEPVVTPNGDTATYRYPNVNMLPSALFYRVQAVSK